MNVVILLVIVFSTLCFVLETEFKQPELQLMWFGFEAGAVTIFTIEFTVRAASCPNLRIFMTTL